MYSTIRDIIAREQIRQQPTAQPAPVNNNQPMNQDDTDDQAMLSPDDIGQQEQEQQMQQEQAQNEGEFPMHEVNADPQRYPVDQAKQLHSFLKNAAGGTGTFVTANKESHEKAKQLARSGHLQHQGSRLGGAGGGLRHVWSLTPKGHAAIGEAPPKAGASRGGGGFGGGGQRPGGNGQRPGGGQQSRPGQGGGQRPQMQQRPGSGSFGSNFGGR
jgi:translation initiation factor IF-2